jgi:uncharacterized coiled-coil DUF342 family protein
LSSSEQRLDSLEVTLNKLIDQRDEYRKKTNKKKDERNRINDEVQQLRKLAVSEKEKRDVINSRVAELKEEVKLLRIKLDKKAVTLDRETEEKNKNKRGLPSKKRMIQELEKIEWTLSTTPTLEIKDREGILVERAREIRAILGEHEKVQVEEDKLMHSLADKRAVELHIRERREEIQRLHMISQEHHERMLQFYKSADEENKRANETHGEFVKALEAMREVNSEIDKVIPKIRELRQELKLATNFKTSIREKALVSKRRELAETARKKLQSGEKLTLEEMKLIYGE